MMSDISLYDPKNADAGFYLRSALLRAAYGPETPPSDIHLRIITWSRASAPNTLKAVASDLKIVEAYQSSRYRPTLPLRPIDLYMLIEDRAQQGISKSSIDRLVPPLVRLHKLLELPHPVDETLPGKQKNIRTHDTHKKR